MGTWGNRSSDPRGPSAEGRAGTKLCGWCFGPFCKPHRKGVPSPTGCPCECHTHSLQEAA